MKTFVGGRGKLDVSEVVEFLKRVNEGAPKSDLATEFGISEKHVLRLKKKFAAYLEAPEVLLLRAQHAQRMAIMATVLFVHGYTLREIQPFYSMLGERVPGTGVLSKQIMNSAAFMGVSLPDHSKLGASKASFQLLSGQGLTRAQKMTMLRSEAHQRRLQRAERLPKIAECFTEWEMYEVDTGKRVAYDQVFYCVPPPTPERLAEETWVIRLLGGGGRARPRARSSPCPSPCLRP